MELSKSALPCDGARRHDMKTVEYDKELHGEIRPAPDGASEVMTQQPLPFVKYRLRLWGRQAPGLKREHSFENFSRTYQKQRNISIFVFEKIKYG